MGRGEFVNAVQDGAILHEGVGLGRDGELLVLFDPVRGVYRGNLHVKGAPSVVRWRDGECMRTMLSERIPETVNSFDSLGLAKFWGNRATGGSGRIRFSRCEHVGGEANGLD